VQTFRLYWGIGSDRNRFVSHTKRQKENTMSDASFQATIIKSLTKLVEDLKAKSPDRSNTGIVIGEAFICDVVEKYAHAQSEAAWAKLETEEIINRTEDLGEGDHTLAESQKFSVQLKQSKPRKNFKAEVLQTALQKKYRVPLHTSKEMIEAAKVPGNPVRTFKIVER
jgi:hypothetical protein